MAPAEHTQLHESPYDIVMAEIGQQRWNHYKKNIVPVEKRYLENIKWMNSPEAANQAVGLAKSRVRSQADPAMREAERSMTINGVSPNSGAFKTRVADMNNRLSTGLADAETTARTTQKNEYLKGLEGYVALGNNQAANAIASMSDVADMARERAMSNASYSAQEDRALGSAAGTAAGIGLGTWGRYNGRGN